MFGGWAWLLNGNLLIGARSDGMLVRLGKGNDDWALRLPDVAPMMMRGRALEGWVRAGPSAYGDDALRLRLIEGALQIRPQTRAKVVMMESMPNACPVRRSKKACSIKLGVLAGVSWPST